MCVLDSMEITSHPLIRFFLTKVSYIATPLPFTPLSMCDMIYEHYRGNIESTSSSDSPVKVRLLILRARFKGRDIERDGCDLGIIHNISPNIKFIRFDRSYLIFIYRLTVSRRIPIPSS